MTVPEVTYKGVSSRRAREVLEKLAERFPTRREGRAGQARTYYDTFDGRLHRDGGTLCAVAHDGSWLLHWRSLDGDERWPRLLILMGLQ